MTRTARIALALGLGQAVLLVVYWAVERERWAESETTLGVDPPARVDGRVQQLSLTTRAGQTFAWTPQRPTLVHVWATWCPACRTELPSILALPADYPFDVVAIALDRDWAEVERSFAGRLGPNVFLGDLREIEAAFDVRTLPVTYLVEPGGRLRLRFEGARDWADVQFVRAWMMDAEL